MLRGGTIKVIEKDNEEDFERRVIHLENFEIEPFGYEDLIENNPSKPLNVYVKLRHALLGEECENIELTNERYKSDSLLRSRFSTQSYALTQGGWFPPGLTTLEDPTYLLDRCAYNDVRSFSAGGDDGVPTRDFLESLKKPGIKINLLPLLIEGNKRRKPTDSEVIDQYQEVIRNLSHVLPHASFTPEGNPAIESAIDLISTSVMYNEQEISFIADIAHLLQSPIGRKRRDEVLQRIILSADLHEIGRTELVCLSAISAAACPQSNNPARSILKIRPGYGDEDIHNALADLRSLKLLIAMYSMAPENNNVFCTSDKNLALFWVGLQAGNFILNDTGLLFTFALSEKLFPEVDLEIFS